jgi:hypothetical protein
MMCPNEDKVGFWKIIEMAHVMIEVVKIVSRHVAAEHWM